MAVRVRLTRVGSRKNPIWRVVVADQRSPRDGRILESVGRYNPQRQPSEIVLDRERIEHWVAHGAQVSETVRSLMRASEREAPPERAAAGGGASRARGGRAAAARPGAADAPPEGAPVGKAPAEEGADEEGTADDASEEAAAEDAAAEEDPTVADAAPTDAGGEVDQEDSESATAGGGG